MTRIIDFCSSWNRRTMEEGGRAAGLPGGSTLGLSGERFRKRSSAAAMPAAEAFSARAEVRKPDLGVLTNEKIPPIFPSAR